MGRQIRKVFTNLVPRCTSRAVRGEKFSFWLPFGDQNECCIGLVTETLKAMGASLDSGFKRPPAFPRRQAGKFKTTKEDNILIFFKPQK